MFQRTDGVVELRTGLLKREVIIVGNEKFIPIKEENEINNVNMKDVCEFSQVYKLSDDAYNTIQADSRSWLADSFCNVCLRNTDMVLVKVPYIKRYKTLFKFFL